MEKIVSLHRQGLNEYHALARPKGREGYDLLRLDREQLEKLRALIDLELGADVEAERAFSERVADALWSKIVTDDGLPCRREELGTHVYRAIAAARWATPLMHQAIVAAATPDFEEPTGKETFNERAMKSVSDLHSEYWNEEKRRDPQQWFRPGLYEHYRGGRYVALFLAEMHDTREKYVVYVSCQHETVSVRPWAKAGEDSWTDEVEETKRMESAGAWIEMDILTPRFKFVGDK